MPEYDQIIKGEVSIEKGKCNNYIITFQSQTDMFLVYQVFTAGDIVGNKHRIIQICHRNHGINYFRMIIM